MVLSWRTLRSALIGLTICVSSAAAETPRVIQRPEWAQKPTFDDMEHFYPERARQEEIPGRAAIQCQVTAMGLLDGCTVVAESPKNYGFGEAAMGLSEIFRMKPKRIDGQPIGGGIVTVPIIFQVPENKPSLGEGAMVMTRVDPSTPAAADIFPCPDGGVCRGHDFMWAEEPRGAEAAAIIASAAPVEGVDFALCTIATDGRLTGCAFLGEFPVRARVASLKAFERLRVPYKTADGTPTAGEMIVIVFPWNELISGKYSGDEATPPR
jgi:TonB family protein